MKILNLYCGVGGNRKLWEGHQITAVENDPEIAAVYNMLYPNDKIVIADAHEYLLEHFNEFDFIWSSPPCPTHSICNHFLHSQGHVRYPDMSLWQEIVFLAKWFDGKWVVENVKSYYPPLWRPRILDRHYFWGNFEIGDFKTKRNFNITNARASTRQNSQEDIANLEDYHKIKLSKNTKNKRLLLRNCVYPELGLHILNSINNNKQEILF